MHRWALAAAVATAILVRLVLAFAAWRSGGAEAFVVPDSATYFAPAKALATRSSFENANGRPEVFRTPLYPLLLSVRPTIPFALAANFVLAAGVVVFTFLFARRLLGGRWGIACAFAAAVEPVTFFWSLKVMPETLLTFLVISFAFCAWRAVETSDRRWSITAAAVISAAAYTKPIAYPLAILVCVAAFVPRPGWLRRGIIMTITVVALLTPWHLRNARVAGYAGFSSQADYALYVSAGGSIEARREGEAYAQVRTRYLQRAAAAERPPYDAMRRDGWSLLRSDPLGYAATHGQGMLRTLFDPGAADFLRLFGHYPQSGGALLRATDVGLLRTLVLLANEQPQAFWPTILLGILLAPLVILPFFIRVTPRTRMGLAILAFVAAYFVISGGGVPGSGRFRVPLVPPLIVMSAAALASRLRTATLRA